MMLRLSLLLALAVCVSTESAALSNVGDQVTNVGTHFLAVTKLFTVKRMTSTVMETQTYTMSVFPTCTTATVASCSPREGKNFNFEALRITTVPRDIEMTAAPSMAAR